MDKHGTHQRPILVAMKGHPGSGKSTLANRLAKALKLPLIDKDHFRDSTQPIQRALARAMPADEAGKLLNDLSYDAMWRSVATQLELGIGVVVDSPLSRRARLDRLLEIASRGGGRVVVVECTAGDGAEWRRRIEAREGGGGWHKPSTWAEMERLLEGYGGCWDYDVGEVPRLVLDTTNGVEVGELVSKVVEFVNCTGNDGH